jgi:uncharacterized protein (DUF433 family)
MSLEGGLIKIDLREPRRALAASLRDLRRARRLVVSDPEILGGDPVFRGTRVPVHLIAQLVAQGGKPAELIDGYPRLTAHGRDDPAGAGLCRRLPAARPAAPAALARSAARAPRPPAQPWADLPKVLALAAYPRSRAPSGTSALRWTTLSP